MRMKTIEISPTKTPEYFFMPRVEPLPDWVTATDYFVGDKISYGSFEYICNVVHTSNDENKPGIGVDWADYWNKTNIKASELRPVYDLSHQEDDGVGTGLV